MPSREEAIEEVSSREEVMEEAFSVPASSSSANSSMEGDSAEEETSEQEISEGLLEEAMSIRMKATWHCMTHEAVACTLTLDRFMNDSTARATPP